MHLVEVVASTLGIPWLAAQQAAVQLEYLPTRGLVDGQHEGSQKSLDAYDQLEHGQARRPEGNKSPMGEGRTLHCKFSVAALFGFGAVQICQAAG